MAQWNQTALVVVDSRRVAERVRAERTVFAALDHFGVAWDVYELGAPTVASDFADGGERDRMAPPGSAEAVRDYVGNRALILLAHDGAGAMPAKMASLIRSAVEGGAGFFAFDREIENWPADLRAMVAGEFGHDHSDELIVGDAPDHFTLVPHEPGTAYGLKRSLKVTALHDTNLRSLVRTPCGLCAVGAGGFGKGRVAFFGTGDRLYDETTLGHAHRLDGLFWRLLVWAARKPFPMRCIPPFLTARFDDCTGSYDAFGYVEPLNRVGIRPNVGLFVDEMSDADWTAARALCAKGGADFSMHAFRDDLLREDPGWTPYRSYDHKPRHARAAYAGLSMDHYTGRDFDEATIRRNFEEVDRRFGERGVRQGRILNAHFGEVGARAIPFFLERGVDIAVNNAVTGRLYGNQPVWRPAPYAMRRPAGRYSIVIDDSPDRSGLFCCGVASPPDTRHFMEGDALWAHTPFVGEADGVKVEEAVRRVTGHMEWALDTLAFGLLMCHEQRVASVSPEDWARIVDGIARRFAGRDVEYAGRERVGVLCKRLFHSRLLRAAFDGDVLRCELTGRTDGPSPLTVWRNEGDTCRREVHEIDAIRGFLEAVARPATR